jgi:flagellar hook assembly protein FlgD
VSRALPILTLALIAVAGPLVAAPAARAAAPLSPAKVVIVVGATHGATASYRSRADAAYAEARKHTSNVVKVYSPNATWSRVRSAAAGASVLIYFGHGNGWPSPYTYDPNYTTKDGFGLNYDNNGDGRLSDHENRYYGEPYVRTLDLAPNAMVMLHHLCYASGNSEPGHAQPSVTVARQRISNYAAGFLRSNARAVLADGHRGPADYLRLLFTTDQTIESMWRTAPGSNGHVSSFTSTRTSGVRALMDPEGTSSGFYRALVTDPLLTTTAVTGVVDTSAHPTTMVVPGRAAVITPDAPLFPDAATAATGMPNGGPTLPAGTRLSVVARSTQRAFDGSVVYEVRGLDDPALTGFVRAGDIAPRDSAAPRVVAVDPQTPVLSPNGDGVADRATLTARLSEAADWRIQVRNAGGAVLHETTGTGTEPSLTWDGLADGIAVADGAYEYVIEATDPWANSGSRSGSLRVDTTGPTLASVTPTEGTLLSFAPNGDGVRDTARLGATTSERGSVAVHVRDAGGTLVRSFSVAAGAAGPLAVTWDGKGTGGALVPDGDYEVRLTARDAVGNVGDAVTRSVRVVAMLGFVTSSKVVFHPHDHDALARATRLSFTLRRAATVTWTIRNASGAVVATLLQGAALPAGVTARNYYGTADAGALLPPGRYTSFVSANDGVLAVTQAIAFEMNAFALRPSASSATRGRSITLSVVSAESLSTSPRVYVTQPGHATWGVTLTRVSSSRYTVTLRLKTGGRGGTVAFRVQAADSGGRWQKTTLTLPLR